MPGRRRDGRKLWAKDREGESAAPASSAASTSAMNPKQRKVFDVQGSAGNAAATAMVQRKAKTADKAFQDMDDYIRGGGPTPAAVTKELDGAFGSKAGKGGGAGGAASGAAKVGGGGGAAWKGGASKDAGGAAFAGKGGGGAAGAGAWKDAKGGGGGGAASGAAKGGGGGGAAWKDAKGPADAATFFDAKDVKDLHADKDAAMKGMPAAAKEAMASVWKDK